MNYDFKLDTKSRNSLSLLINRIKPGGTILEFGPANGRMTKYLKEELNCKVYGVEINAEAAKDARMYAQKIVVDSIETYSWKKEFAGIKFDYILFADVLEHLYNPAEVLESIKEFLKDDGSVLITIPNIAHNSIIINLLKNQFDYSSTGLLDSTHIKFYTKKTFDELVKNSGYFIGYESAVYMAPQSSEFKNSYKELPQKVGEFLSGLPWGELYQLVYELKKNEVDTISDFRDEYKSFGTSYIQLFAETGSGYNEQESIRIAYENQSTVTFDLTNYGNIRELRFDPIDNYLFLKLKSITVDGENYIGKIASNAFYVNEGMYYFDHNDPQIYLNFLDDKKIESVSFEIEYVLVGEDTFEQIKDVQKQQIIKKEQEIKIKNQHIKNLQTVIANKSMEVQQLNDNIVHLNALAQSLRIKNRIKRVLPASLKNILKRIVAKYRYLNNKFTKFRLLADTNGTFFTLKQLYKSKFYKNRALTFKNTNVDLETIETVKETLSIVIPTYNGLSDLVKLIPQLISQKGFEKIEIIIIDSSSSDKTEEFIQMFPSVKFITIEQKDFSHSYARNFGYENSTGEYVLFLVQDALPSSNMWLYSFYHIMAENNLSALSCVQIVNADADLYTCYGIDNFNKYLGLKNKTTKITEKYIEGTDFSRQLAQLDNVSCLFKSSEFEKYRFAGRYAEDLDIGLRMIKEGKRIGITSEIAVIHSHLRSPYYYMKRALVETDVLNEMFEVKTDENIVLKDELWDIYGAFCLVGNLISELEKLNRFPVNFEYFYRYVTDNLEMTIAKEYGEDEFKIAYNSIDKYDNEFAQMIKIFHENNIRAQKGALYYAMDHLIREGISYIEQRYTNIDEKIFFEFCFFIIKIFATNVGVKLGTYKAVYEKSDSFMNQMIPVLQKGV